MLISVLSISEFGSEQVILSLLSSNSLADSICFESSMLIDGLDL
jgi:hypothetical protein